MTRSALCGISLLIAACAFVGRARSQASLVEFEEAWSSSFATVALALGLAYALWPSEKQVADFKADDAVIAQRHRVRSIMRRHGALLPQPVASRPLDVIDMDAPFRGSWRYVVIILTIGTIIVPLALWLLGCVASTGVVLTVYGFYNAWKMGLHVAIFACVGCDKVALYQKTDFKAMYEAQQTCESPELSWRKWEDILHFVIMPNYKEDPEVLRRAVESIASSAIAAKQVCLVLAMEAREVEAEEKSEQLRRQFDGQFKHFITTYHPEGLPGEMPGKSSNTRWAANQILDVFMPQHQVDPACAVFTVADADSEFHAEYFAALTYHFLSAGAAEEETPRRQLMIWQPPILHFKNYISQPALVKWCSLMTSLHELACLADHSASRIAYSTYSISADLASAVRGWDPDWISEDWHMTLKCFLATGGRLRIAPIFLPILNYAPEAESAMETNQARWAQGKRHALGFAELVYFLDHFPRVLGCIRSRWDRAVFVWRSFFMWTNCLMTHLVMATYWFLTPLNGIYILWYVRHGSRSEFAIEDGIFLANFLSQALICISFLAVCIASVRVYECVKGRIRGSDSASLSKRWRCRYLHSVATIFETASILPLFFILAAGCEWVAAFKTAHTHRFDYEVALKPCLSKLTREVLHKASESPGVGDSNSESTCAESRPISEQPSEDEKEVVA